jgi:hypothetical protein
VVPHHSQGCLFHRKTLLRKDKRDFLQWVAGSHIWVRGSSLSLYMTFGFEMREMPDRRDSRSRLTVTAAPQTLAVVGS